MREATFALPPGWARVEIERVLAPQADGRLLHHGWSPQCEAEPRGRDDEWGVLKTTAVQDGSFAPEHNKRLPTALPPRPELEVREGDLLLTCAGPRARCGVPCLVRRAPRRLILSGKMYRFRVREDVITPSFLEAQLRSHAAQSTIDAMKTGISDSGLNLTHDRFLALPTLVPPVPEQRRIVEALETHLPRLDAAVATLERVRANLRRYRAAVIQAAVEGRLGPTAGSSAWRRVPVSELLRDSGYGTSAKCSYDGDGMPVLRIPNVAGGRIDLSDVKFATGDLGISPTDALKPGDFLIVRTNGSRSLIGRGAVVTSPMKRSTHFASYLIRLRLRDPELVGAWLGVVWQSPSMRTTIEAAAATSAGQYNLSLRSILAFRVPLPPDPEIPEIVAAVDAQTSVAEAAERLVGAQVARCARLRQSLLRLAFDGRLVPQDLRDEPASVLLDRIRAERAAESSSPKKTSSRSRR